MELSGGNNISWKARVTALCALARLGLDAIPLLLDGLDNLDPEIRNLAAQAMGYMGGPGQAARMERLMVEDPDGVVRVYAGMARAMIGGPIPADLAKLVAQYDPLRMAKTRLDLAMKRPPGLRNEPIRETLAAFDLSRMDSARIGQRAPDFILYDQSGTRHQLSEYKGKKSVVLIFVYGVTCMYCTGQIAQIRARLHDFEANDAQVLFVESSESYRAEATLEVVHGPGTSASLSLLSDPSHTVAAAYGVAMQMHHIEWLNRPSSFVIDRDGMIRYEKRGLGVSDRPSPSELLAEVRRLHDSKSPSMLMPPGETH